MIDAVLAFLFRPAAQRLKPCLAAVGRWCGLLFIIGLSMTTGAAIALAIVADPH